MHSLQTISRLNEQEYQAYQTAIAEARALGARNEALTAAYTAKSAEKVAQAVAARNAAILANAQR